MSHTIIKSFQTNIGLIEHITHFFSIATKSSTVPTVNNYNINISGLSTLCHHYCLLCNTELGYWKWKVFIYSCDSFHQLWAWWCTLNFDQHQACPLKIVHYMTEFQYTAASLYMGSSHSLLAILLSQKIR